MKRRFESEQQILNAIDRNRACIHRGMVNATRLEDEAKEHFKEGSSTKGNKCLETANRKRRHIVRLEAKARALGEKLSEFRTVPCFPLIGMLGIGDCSVKAV